MIEYSILIFLLIGTGIILHFFTPPPNGWFGYRTLRTLRDGNAWKIANKAFGLDLIIIGCCVLLAMVYHIYVGEIKIEYFVYGLLLLTFLSILKTEAILRRKKKD